jgi:hypothetical protein
MKAKQGKIFSQIEQKNIPQAHKTFTEKKNVIISVFDYQKE